MTEIALKIQLATHDDVSRIVQMLSDDPLGAKRERFVNPLPETYLTLSNP